MNKSKILIVDDHPIVRQGISQLINQAPDLIVAGEADTPHKALKCLTSIDPDLVMVDISLGDCSGIELLKDLRIHHPKLPVLVLSMHSESLYAERVLRLGARGYIMKDQATDLLIQAIRQVLAGKVYLSPDMSSRMLDLLVDGRSEPCETPVQRLSNRELEVFELIGRGLGTREIAEQLSLSIKTVEAHRAHIKEKLNLQNSVELLQSATIWMQGENTAPGVLR